MWTGTLVADSCRTRAAFDALHWHDRMLLPPVDTSAFPPTLGITRPCGLMHEEW
jgi:hypothetical protein